VNPRYVSLGTIDGTLITLGVLTATREISAPTLTLAVAMAAGISSALSNSFGAYVAESTMAERELSEYAKHLMIPTLDGTATARAYRLDTYTNAATMGLFALLGASVPMLPVIFLGLGASGRTSAIALSLVTLFFLGAYVGARSKRSLVPMGLRTALLGVLVTFLAWGISQILVST